MTSVQLSHLDGTFEGAHDLALYYQAWYPSGSVRHPPKAVVALVHGLGEHCDRYEDVALALPKAGYALFGFDNQGHGRSAGQRGHIDCWQDYRDNVQAFLKKIRTHEPDTPLFILGHSLGGLIVLDYVLKHPEDLQGVIVSGPPIVPVGVSRPYLVAFARMFSNLLPRLSLKIGGLGSEALSRDPQAIAKAKADPMMHSLATLRWGTETLDAISTVRKHISHLKLPILLIHGDADRVNAVDGSQELYQNITYADKTLKIYPGGYHELHNDLDRDQVLQDLIVWLDDHVSPPGLD